MKLYDHVIADWNRLLSSQTPQSLRVSEEIQWKDVKDGNMILGCDMAYELGGGSLPALSGTVITAREEFVSEDEILLYGLDLPRIKRDVPYARLAIVRVKEEEMGNGNTLYNAIRKIEYSRYHVNPEGFMMRISVASERESVRIGEEALAKGLDFEKAGNLILRAFHQNPKVEAVKLIFITLEDFPYRELEGQIRQAEKITRTIDHIMKNVIMDCKSCSLQEICDEVEGLRELHFAK